MSLACAIFSVATTLDRIAHSVNKMVWNEKFRFDWDRRWSVLALHSSFPIQSESKCLIIILELILEQIKAALRSTISLIFWDSISIYHEQINKGMSDSEQQKSMWRIAINRIYSNYWSNNKTKWQNVINIWRAEGARERERENEGKKNYFEIIFNQFGILRANARANMNAHVNVCVCACMEKVIIWFIAFVLS